jgi:peptide/nickel transport system permease protein
MGYILRRASLAIVTLWVVSVVSYAVVILPPGGAGIDRSFPGQQLKWTGMMLRGRFGSSQYVDRTVVELIRARLAMTVVISVAALLLTWVVASPVGIYSAVRQYSVVDYVATVFGFIGIATPAFLLALIVVFLGWRWFDTPIGGLFSREYQNAPWTWAKVRDWLNHLPVPILILSISGMASLIRIMRANLLDELRKPYVITARAKGLAERRLIVKYPVRVALNPFASTAGYLLPSIVSGSVIIFVVLSLPTMGTLLLESIVLEDYLLAGTIVLLLGALTIVGTFLSDLLLMWIDPRIRVEGRR